MEKKNIIFIICDQLQKRTTEKDSPCIMPNLQRLRNDSVDFPNAHTANAICSPSRASLMTARLPHNHGMVDCTHTVPKYRADYDSGLDTISRRLSEEGYSLSYYGKWHVERSYKLEDYGFEEYETELDLPSFSRTPIKRLEVQTEGYDNKVICGVYEEGEDCTEEAYIYSKAIDFIERKKTDAPFCTFISAYAPHDPYTVPQEVYKLYEGKELPLPESFFDNMEDKPAVYRRLKNVWAEFGEDEAREIMRCYYSYCTLVDIQVGKLLKYLKDKNLYDDTIIVFTADHGDMMGAHGLFCKGVPCFEETYAIPLIIKQPGNIKSGISCNAYVNMYDIAPTVLEMSGCSPLKNTVDGHSIIPYLNGVADENTFCYAEFEGQRYSYTQRLVWKDGFKYVFNAFDFDEFYDLKNDPYELNNLSDHPDYLAKKKELVSLMWKRIAESGDDTMGDAQYIMHRFAPEGPRNNKKNSEFLLYNKSF